MYLDDCLTSEELHEANEDMRRARQLAGGACVTCMDNGTVAFPLDPGYHEYRSGHAPVLTGEGAALLAQWAEGRPVPVKPWTRPGLPVPDISCARCRELKPGPGIFIRPENVRVCTDCSNCRRD
jgi:hypothetical protein